MIAGTLSLYDELVGGRGTDSDRRAAHSMVAAAS
jgi:hypothetical protein